MESWRGRIEDQLKATSQVGAVRQRRELVENRWRQLNALGTEHGSPSKLSPNSKQIRQELFQNTGELKDATLKTFKKKFAAMIQSLNNASERLNEVHIEECHFAKWIGCKCKQ